MRKEIEDLLSCEDDYDEDFILPTDHAIEVAEQFLEVLGDVSVHLSTMGLGDIRIHPSGEEVQDWVIAVHPYDSGTNYYYWDVGEKYGTFMNFQPEALKMLLDLRR